MIVEVKVLLDDSIPEQAALLRQLLGIATNAPAGVPAEFIIAVRGTKVGRVIVIPLVSQMVVGRRYKPKDLAEMLDMEAKVLGKRFTVLGRTEQRFGGLRIFQRHGAGRDREYSISAAMKEAFGEM